MRTADFDYELPPELIAKRPIAERDGCRLLWMGRGGGQLKHLAFRDIRAVLKPGDRLVFNDTRVIPARLFCTKAGTGAALELFFTERAGEGGRSWRALVKPAKRAPAGTLLAVDGNPRIKIRVDAVADDGYERIVSLMPPDSGAGGYVIDTNGINTNGIDTKGTNAGVINTNGINNKGTNAGININGINNKGTDGFINTNGINTQGTDGFINTNGINTQGTDGFINTNGINTQGTDGFINTNGINNQGTDAGNNGYPDTIDAVIAAYGRLPLPHYMERDGDAFDDEMYQTVYADRPGAVAAPTAGLHFTKGLLAELAAMGVGMSFVTLHVGAGTFRPVQADDPREHGIHEERFEMSVRAADEINATWGGGGRVIAVGTTSVRVLESCAVSARRVAPKSGRTKLMILPPYEFMAVDGLVTNFHLPKSTLLMLVSAFASREAVLGAYREAVARGYRFFSYGDAMAVI